MSATNADTTASNPFTDLTGFQRDLLVAIADVEENGSNRKAGNKYDDPTGQCVKDRVEDYGHGEVNHGRLYPNLDTLMHKDLIEKEAADRRTNYYLLTEEGEEALEQYAEFVEV